jgi:hypothetical protein
MQKLILLGFTKRDCSGKSIAECHSRFLMIAFYHIKKVIGNFINGTLKIPHIMFGSMDGILNLIYMEILF